MIRAVFRVALLASCLASFAACGDDECDERVALPCDIREAACRCTVFDETRKVRSQDGAHMPPARVISRDQYARETRSESAEQMVDEGARVYQQVLKVLGLLPLEMSLDEAETEAQIRGVAAYYDSRDKRITIIADSAMDPSEGVFTLSHEYVHALQDQREGIAKLWNQERSTDGLLSVKTLLEGEATLLSDVVLLKARARTFDASALAAFERLYDLTLQAIGQSMAPLTEAQLSLAYPVGANTLGKAYVARGVEGVAGFFRNRPSTVAGWIDESRAPTLPETVSCARPEAPQGYMAWGVDRLGATAAVALGASLGFDGEGMRNLARKWSGDQFALYSVAGMPTAAALSWYITFADADLATRLELRLREARPGLEITRNAGTLHLVGASDAATLAGWSARQVCTANKARGVDEEPTRIGPKFGHIWPLLARFHRARAGHATAHEHDFDAFLRANARAAEQASP